MGKVILDMSMSLDGFIAGPNDEESALTQAQAVAGDKNVVIGGGANTAQQFINAGLIDELQIHLVPVLLGEGFRLFDHFGSKLVKLEKTCVVDTPDGTHLTVRIVK